MKIVTDCFHVEFILIITYNRPAWLTESLLMSVAKLLQTDYLFPTYFSRIPDDSQASILADVPAIFLFPVEEVFIVPL